ncbi:MAG: hypothetical protein ACYST5_20540 [Planctomycetota bacterium]|jgi:hypothetical protein
MKLRVDRNELLRTFATIEAIIVGVPMIAYMIVIGGMYIALLSGFEMLFLPIYLIVLFIGSFYHLLPVLVAPDFIRCASPLPFLVPRGLYGWIFVIAFYSAIALILTFIASLYIPENGND